jgi:putative transposase
VLHSDRFVDAAPAEVWATLFDEGVYLGSQSTFLPAAEPSRRGA